MPVTLTELQRKQIAEAEELLFSGPQKEGFAKELFLGRFRAAAMLPYPALSPEAQRLGDAAVAEVQEFCQQQLDAAAVDRDACIPDHVVEGLGKLGVLGMTIAAEHGGRGFSQQNFCRVMEVIGGHCGSTAVFVNAHHSIGLRALDLFGTHEQKSRWMKPLAAGEQLSAFALTEPHAGSDASNVQTTATPSEDGAGYLLNGEKRWITNGGIAGMLTVMARTPDPLVSDGKITAFLVTPDMEGFRVVEARMDKCGIRGTATARLQFHNMFVPRENILGPLGGGLKVALTVLNFGRTAFGASCTGAAKSCVERLVHRANTRRQFGRSLGEFELVKAKLATAAADTFAMESATCHTAAVIDSGSEDYMLETAMLKVFASDQLWRIVNDTIQVWGGKGFFTDEPLERMMRDARLNQIGEGANDVLRCFIAAVGVRGLGLELQELRRKPWQIPRMLRLAPRIPVGHGRLRSHARQMARQIGQLARLCQRALIKHREAILEQQFILAAIGDMATELFAASCVYARIDTLLSRPNGDPRQDSRDVATGELYLQLAERRNRTRLAELKNCLQHEHGAVADLWRKTAGGALPEET